MIKPNIGILNALIRITCGFVFLSYSTVRMVRHPLRKGSFFLSVMAAMKIGEGIVRYCPVTDWINKMEQEDQIENLRSNESQAENVINPS
ncbi:YgaP family membrane protein [Aquibacillus kalidii]|uniref:YgaP family membrane protein n=1 Tax=Aquibacillus kalidii TaxID=2762597 RepID=UPI001645B5B8|nr:DUF2892 domain-containing protein [Aquibacillus kalidii]